MNTESPRQIFFDNQVVGMMEVDADGHYIRVNQQWLNMIGYDAEEIISASFQTLTHPEDLPQQQLLDQQLVERKCSSYRMDKRYIHKDGHTIWCDLSVTALYDSQQKLTGMVGLAIDISEKKVFEKRLLEAKELQKSLLDSSPDTICFKDGEGRWILANKASLDLFELRNIDYRGKTDKELAATQLHYSEALMECHESDEDVWNAGIMRIGEKRIPTPGGEEKIFEVIKTPLFHADGRRKTLIVLGRDITVRKKELFWAVTLPSAKKMRTGSRRAKPAFAH